MTGVSGESVYTEYSLTALVQAEMCCCNVLSFIDDFHHSQLRYQKCLDARPPSSGSSCLPGPPADSVARRVGSSVKKGVQSLLGSFKRSGSQTP